MDDGEEEGVALGGSVEAVLSGAGFGCGSGEGFGEAAVEALATQRRTVVSLTPSSRASAAAPNELAAIITRTFGVVVASA